MRIDVGSVDGSRRVAAPAAVPGSRSGTVGIQSDDISIQPNGMQATASHESEVLDGQLALSDELTQALGLNWTRQNPVWTSQALNRMRSLQHVLMKKAFSLPRDSRQPVLEGDERHTRSYVCHSGLRKCITTAGPGTPLLY